MEEYGKFLIQKMVAQFNKIEWEVERINNHARIFKTFAEQIFQDDRGRQNAALRGRGYPRPWAKPGKAPKIGAKSCLFLANVTELSAEDRRFLRLTESMDSIFAAVVPLNPHILFVHMITPSGITRGYPLKDFSVLAPGFNPVLEGFFYSADKEHNPELKEKWSEPYLCPLAQTWMATCSSPLYEDDRLLCIIGIDVDLGRIIVPADKILKLIPGGYAFLVSQKGNLVISSDEGMNSLREDNILINRGWLEAGETDRRSVEDVHVREVTLSSGKAYLLQAYLECNGWSIVSVLPRNRRVLTKSLSLAAKGTVVPSSAQSKADMAYLPMMSFISSFTESLKHMERLIEGTKIIGKGILDHRVAVESKDEIGLLGISINKMAAELEKRRVELESAFRKISQMDRLSALGKLTAGIAHEINNPLSIISNYVQLLLRNPGLQPQIQADFRIIEDEIQRMSAITRRLLSFSGEKTNIKSVTQVNGILQAILEFLNFHLKSQGIILSEEYADDLPFVLGNPTELQQAFLNILLNAAQAMPQGGRLKVSTRYIHDKGKTKKGRIQIRISDTGTGIDEKFLDKIFDPFFTLKERGEGTGLGLSISYGVIKEHEGAIDVKSKPDKGTTVLISLPVLDPQSPLRGVRNDESVDHRR
jgi:signal transduction histidine kinase